MSDDQSPPYVPEYREIPAECPNAFRGDCFHILCHFSCKEHLYRVGSVTYPAILRRFAVVITNAHAETIPTSSQATSNTSPVLGISSALIS